MYAGRRYDAPMFGDGIAAQTEPDGAGQRTSLDAAQEEAVGHGEGPCLVLAGPGSGKTRVIAERFLRLARQGSSPDRLLVLTYTRQAAAEMRDRVERIHGPFEGEPPLANYHSFAQRLLRRFGFRLGISPAFRIADEAERWLVVEAIVRELRPPTLYNPLRPDELIDSVLELIEKAKQELVSAEQYAAWAEARLEAAGSGAEGELLLRHRDCAEVYRRLERRFLERAILDHDDTILYAQRLLQDDAEVRAAVAGSIDYVMVDEYQDTNYAQARLVECLAGERANLLVVADDDQSIYKFRGASLANLQRFERLFPQHRRIVLDVNYRSHQVIVDVSRALIGAASPGTRIEKHLRAQRGAGGAVEVWQAGDERAEVTAVAGECARLVAEGTDPDAIAWLFRRHDDMRPAIRALEEAGVAYTVHGGRGFFQCPEVKDLVALLTAVGDPDNSQAVLRCLSLPAYAVSNAGRLSLSRAAREHDVPLLAVIDAGMGELSPADAAAAQRLGATLLELHGEVVRADVRDLFFSALEATQFLGVIAPLPAGAQAQAGANLNKFGELLEAFADWSEDRSLGLALRYLAILRRDSRAADEIPAVDSAGSGVHLLTAHAAKGLEWPVVFLGRCSEERWPGRGGYPNRLTLPDELVPEPPPAGEAARDEERRLLYVAATRARDRLVFAHARRYPHSFQNERASPFLGPLDGEVGILRRSIAGSPPPAPRLLSAPVGGDGPLRASVSDLATFRECPRRYAYRSILRLPARPSEQRWYGTLMHRVLQDLAGRRRAGAEVSADDAARLWASAWELARGPKGAHPELRDLGEEQLRRYLASPGWLGARPVDLERPFALSLGIGEVSGRWDRVDELTDGERVVVDYKTGPPRGEAELRRDLQVRAYGVAVARERRADASTVELHWLQTAEVSRLSFDETALRRNLFQLESVAVELADARRRRDYPPRPSAWRCARCDYRTVCDEGRGAAE